MNETSTEKALRVIDRTMPNGFADKVLMFGDKQIGSYTVQDGGYLPWGKRKPRPTEFDAILDIIADRQREIAKQAVWIERVRDAAFTQQGEFKSKESK